MEAPERARSGGCRADDSQGDCPIISATDRDTIAVQGHTLAIQTPVGVAVVEIPKDLLREAVRALAW